MRRGLENVEGMVHTLAATASWGEENINIIHQGEFRYNCQNILSVPVKTESVLAA